MITRRLGCDGNKLFYRFVTEEGISHLLPKNRGRIRHFLGVALSSSKENSAGKESETISVQGRNAPEGPWDRAARYGKAGCTLYILSREKLGLKSSLWSICCVIPPSVGLTSLQRKGALSTSYEGVSYLPSQRPVMIPLSMSCKIL